MGLDMYINRVEKIELEDKVYTSDEINEISSMICTLEEFERAGDSLAQLLPYASKVNIINKYYNLEKMAEDNGLAHAHIGLISGEKIGINGKDSSGETTLVYIPTEVVNEKYIIERAEESYVWSCEEVAYWRKHYPLQDYFYELIGNVENCGYYLLDEEMICDLKEKWLEEAEDIPIEAPTDTSALFYHEWY